jgi:hypothetical protein
MGGRSSVPTWLSAVLRKGFPTPRTVHVPPDKLTACPVSPAQKTSSLPVHVPPAGVVHPSHCYSTHHLQHGRSELVSSTLVVDLAPLAKEPRISDGTRALGRELPQTGAGYVQTVNRQNRTTDC